MLGGGGGGPTDESISREVQIKGGGERLKNVLSQKLQATITLNKIRGATQKVISLTHSQGIFKYMYLKPT